jgi:hypothetical protein
VLPEVPVGLGVELALEPVSRAAGAGAAAAAAGLA